MKMVLIQIIGAIGILIKIISIEQKEKKDILSYQGVAFIIISLQYYLLGAYTPASLNASTSLRSFIFYNYSKNNKAIPIFWLFIFLFITLLLGVITWSGFLGLIPVINTTMYVVSSWLKDAKWLRVFYVIAALLFMCYNFNVGAYAMLVGNLFEVITGTHSIFRFDKRKK